MDTITLFYEANFILKRDQYKNEEYMYDMVILNKLPLMFRKRDVQYPNIVKILMNLFKITLKYVKNLFRNNNEQEITLRNKNEFKKSRKKKNSIYEKSIIIKINSIEQEISKLEKNLDNLINHMKETPKCNIKNTICFSLLKICVPLIIMFGFMEFQVRVKPKKIYN